MIPPAPHDTKRARGIVRLAATMVKNKSAKSWLHDDPRGAWELLARDLLVETALKATQLELSVERVDEQIATYLGYLSLKAMLPTARRRKVNPT